jgi:hypothetical protein
MADFVLNEMNTKAFRSATVAGAGADTNMAVTGILTTDKLWSVIEIATTTGIPTDRTSTTSITSDGNIQCSVATTGDKLIVLWIRKLAEAS